MLIDANIFLELLLDQEKAQKCEEILEKARKGIIQAVVSTFTIDGIALVLEKYGRKGENIERFLRSLASYKGLMIYTPTMNDRFQAIAHMKTGLDFEDAMTAQSALASNVKEILSFDKHFDKIKNIKRIEP